jgi:hypothetical protein
MESNYDVFKGSKDCARWLGTVTGLDQAVDLMNRMVEHQPGNYFVLSQVSQDVVASIHEEVAKSIRVALQSRVAKAS